MDMPGVCIAQIARRLRHRLVADGLIMPNAALRRLTGGRTNLVWRSRGPEGPVICKLSMVGRDTPLFPNQPLIEVQAMQALSDRGLAPRFLAQLATPHGPCLIYAATAGRTWHRDPGPVAATLARLHSVVPLPGLRRVSVRPVDVLAQGDGLLAQLSDPGALQASRPDAAALDDGVSVFLHGDPVPGNVVMQKGQAVLIDWQCPALGDPVHDLSLFLSPAMQTLGRGRPLSGGERAVFLDAYGDEAARRRLAVAEPALSWRMATYCAWRVSRGQGEYEQAGQAELDHLQQLR